MKDLDFNTFSELYETVLPHLQPDQPLLIFKDRKITVSGLIHCVEQYTWCLRKIGIKRGTMVVYSLPDCLEIFYFTIAISRIGACAIPIHHLLPTSHKISILQLFNTPFLFSDSTGLGEIKKSMQSNNLECTIITLERNEESDYSFTDLIPGFNKNEYAPDNPRGDDPLFAISSSGTTGIPKFLMITQRNLVNVVKATRYFMEPLEDFKNGFKILCAFPMSTSSILTLLAEFFFGKTIIIPEDYSPITFLTLIEQHKVDGLAATPGYYEGLIQLPVIHNFTLDSVKRVYSGMDFLPNKRLYKLKKIFKNMRIAGIGYGLAETSSVVMVWQAFTENEFTVPTDCFTPIPDIGNEFKIIDKQGNECPVGELGEIMIKGNNVTTGYYKNPEENKLAFTNEGWFHTGDLGCTDKKARILLRGRMKYVIKRGGRSLSPIVINNHIMSYEKVNTSAVVGVPHEMFGEMIWAFIKPEKGKTVTKGEIIKHCREGLPPFMIPDHISFINELPKNKGAGKLNHEKLINIAKKEVKKMTGGTDE